MPTLGQLLRRVPHGFVLLAGSIGLGREVARIVELQASEMPGASIDERDLVVYAGARDLRGSSRGEDATLVSLLYSGSAGVVTDVEPIASEVQRADTCGAPLLATIGGITAEELYGQLVRALEVLRAETRTQQAAVEHLMLDLAAAGATPSMLLDRLVALTGKCAQVRPSVGDTIVQPAILQDLDRERIHFATEITARATRRWLNRLEAGTLDVLYLEVPSERLVRLVAPIWMDGTQYAELSLFARPAELAASDRITQLATAAALSKAFAYSATEMVHLVKGRCFAIAMRSAEVSTNELVAPARQQFSRADIALAPETADEQLVLAVGSVDRADWSWRLADWQARLSDELGPISVGYALRTGAHPDQLRAVRAQATEALLVGDRLFAPGHLTSYPDAHLAEFLLESRGAAALRSLYEEVVGRLSPEDDARLHRDLVRTLQVYCEEVSTQRTAERLHVHRNTVLYRLKQIEEITSFDLEDAPTRLLLRLGFFAGQLVRQTRSRAAAERSSGVRRHLGFEETLSA